MPSRASAVKSRVKRSGRQRRMACGCNSKAMAMRRAAADRSRVGMRLLLRERELTFPEFAFAGYPLPGVDMGDRDSLGAGQMQGISHQISRRAYRKQSQG